MSEILLSIEDPAIGFLHQIGRQMAAAGNVYRHDYEDVLAQRVWDTVQKSLTGPEGGHRRRNRALNFRQARNVPGQIRLI